MEKKELIVIGNVQADLLMGAMDVWPEMGTETILKHSDWRVGGSAGNTALALKELGEHFSLLTTVGNDDIGDWLSNTFSFCTNDILRSDTTTTITVGIIHKDDERTFLTSQGHLELFRMADICPAIEAMPSCRGGVALLSGVFLSSQLIDEYDRFLDFLISKDMKLAIDPGWPSTGWDKKLRQKVLSWFRRCEHILINEKEATALTEEKTAEEALATLSNLLGDNCKIVIKNGADGALARCGNEVAAVSAPAVQPIDTVGAGDCFNAGYIYGIQNGFTLRDSLKYGVVTASLAISSFPRKYPSERMVRDKIDRSNTAKQSVNT